MDEPHVDRIMTELPGLRIQAHSLTRHDEAAYALTQPENGQQRLVVVATAGSPLLDGFVGERSDNAGSSVLLGPLSSENATTLRGHLDWLRPTVLGLRTVWAWRRPGICARCALPAATWRRCRRNSRYAR